MSFEMPEIPEGTGAHPIALVALSANNAASSPFYSRLFGWQLTPMSAELTAVVTPGGPMIALRSGVPDGFPGLVPYLGAADVKAMLDRVVDAGGSVEKAPWNVPMVGTLARFKDPSGTIYGLTSALSPDGNPRVPMPFGTNPKPPAGALCSLEMYAADGEAAGRFFGDLFGWGTRPTMPQFVGFDPGKGIGGVYQSHTPALTAVGYIFAEDVEAKMAEIEAAGGRKQGDPMRVPGLGCFGYFTDPSGTTMGLIGA